jgi:two-component system invasion response regulator UvrY
MSRILIVDDHVVARDGVRKILEKQPGAIFGEASNAADALKLAREQEWDVVVLDLSLGGRDGLEVLREIKKTKPRLPVLILSMHSEELFARRALKAGAAGYLTKNSTRSELTRAVNIVSRGEVYISPNVAQDLVTSLRQNFEGQPHESLSDREFEVFRLMASGKTSGEIADILSLSDSTISTYRARILEKMGMKTNAELMHYAMQHKLVD